MAENKSIIFVYLLLFGALAYLLGLSFFAYSYTIGPNYRNVTIDTRVNITGSAPTILTIIMANPVTLNAGSEYLVTCNSSVRDYNGFADIFGVNATLYHSSSTAISADDNNTHYTNTSCAVVQQSGIMANYTCSFGVQYYALNGTWNCTVGVNDTIGLTHAFSNSTSINALYALNITPTLIDYGNLSQGNNSNNITVNVTNFGNLNINISVLGYAVTIGDNLSFICAQGNLTTNVQHFAGNSTAPYEVKQNLTGAYQTIKGLTINKTNNITHSLNETTWEMYADPTQIAFGNCSGFLVFQADAAT